MIKKNDFVEIEYTGSLKENGMVFDTTSEAVAKENHIHNPKAKYKARTVCIGMKQILPGLDEALEGKEIGKEYSVEIPVEKAFGKKDAKMIQLVSTAKFKQARIQPMVGMQVTIDEQMGVIRTVSGGRTIVDFNHPLSGKDVHYTFKIVGQITDDAKKVSTMCTSLLGMENIAVTVADKKATVPLMFDLPQDIQKILKDKIIAVVPLEDIIFTKTAPVQKQPAQPAVAQPTQ